MKTIRLCDLVAALFEAAREEARPGEHPEVLAAAALYDMLTRDAGEIRLRRAA